MEKIVLLDVDGVVADFVLGFLNVHSLLTPQKRPLRPEDVSHWDIITDLGVAKGSALESAIWDEIKTPGYARNLPILSAAYEVRKLEEIADVYWVTSPVRGAPTWTHDRERWLAMHFGTDPERVIHTSQKWLVHGDVFVDDNPSNVARWQEAHPKGLGLLWQTPRVPEAEWTGERAETWGDVYWRIRGLP